MSRLPTEIQTARMGRLSRLPAFFALAGKRAVVAGGGQAAAWKAELLSAAGAAVDVFAPQAGEDMRALAAAPPGGAVAIHERAWTQPISPARRSRSPNATTMTKPRASPPRRARPACRSM